MKARVRAHGNKLLIIESVQIVLQSPKLTQIVREQFQFDAKSVSVTVDKNHPVEIARLIKRLRGQG